MSSWANLENGLSDSHSCLQMSPVEKCRVGGSASWVETKDLQGWATSASAGASAALPGSRELGAPSSGDFKSPATGTVATRKGPRVAPVCRRCGFFSIWLVLIHLDKPPAPPSEDQVIWEPCKLF